MAARRRLAAVPDSPGRVVLYVRVSAVMGRGDDMLSPSIQLGAMRRTVGLAGLHEVAVIDDDIDQTGRVFDRRGLDKIRALAKAGKIDALAIYNIARFGRNVREGLTFLSWLADRGIQVISATEQIDTSTPAGRLMLTNMLAIAEYQSDEIGRGWSAAIARRAESGRHHGNTLGYVRRDKRLHVDPLLGPVIAQAWRDYAAKVPIGRIAAQVARARGRPMATSNVKTIFRNPVYLGHVTANGEIVARDAHDPLVDQQTWDRVQARLVRDAGTPPRHLEKSWALVGMCFCPAGHRLQRWPSRYRGQLVDRLVCGMGTTSRGVHGGCDGIGTPRLDAIEAQVLRQVAEHIVSLRTDHVARAQRLAREHADVVDAKRLRDQLGRTRDAIGKLAKAWALGDLSDAEYHQPVAELKAEAATLERAFAAIREPERRPAPREAANAAEALLAMWSDPEVLPDEKNRILRTVVRRIMVRRAERWREPEADRVVVEFV